MKPLMKHFGKNVAQLINFVSEISLWLEWLALLVFCSGDIDDQEWRFLLTGGVVLENRFPNPAKDWLSDRSWSEIVHSSSLPALRGFMDHFKMNVILNYSFKILKQLDFTWQIWSSGSLHMCLGVWWSRFR